jgi:hypothetical protein
VVRIRHVILAYKQSIKDGISPSAATFLIAAETQMVGMSLSMMCRSCSHRKHIGAEDVGNSTSSAPADVESQCVSARPRDNSLLRRGVLTIGVALGGAGQNLLRDQTGVLPDRRFDFRGHVGIGLEESF